MKRTEDTRTTYIYAYAHTCAYSVLYCCICELIDQNLRVCAIVLVLLLGLFDGVVDVLRGDEVIVPARSNKVWLMVTINKCALNGMHVHHSLDLHIFQ